MRDLFLRPITLSDYRALLFFRVALRRLPDQWNIYVKNDSGIVNYESFLPVPTKTSSMLSGRASGDSESYAIKANPIFIVSI